MMRPAKHDDHQLFQRPEIFSSNSDDLMKLPKRPKKKRKKLLFKFNEDSMEFNKGNSMEFNRHNSMSNSMEFPSSMNNNNNHRVKKQKNVNFEKSYDELVNSAKKLCRSILMILID